MAFESLLYDPVRDWIKEKRKSEVSWDDIMTGMNKLSQLLDSMESFFNWPHMTEDDWLEIVEQQRISEENTEKILSQVKSATIHDEHEENVVSDIPRGENSAWQSYRRKLKAKDFKEASIDEIEKTTYKLLKRLSLDTTQIPPRKGLVIGNVQSGKTANMAALMAMAADWGWNLFIILSGTIDNLREQTQNRLFGDLHDPVCKIQWISLDKLRPNMITGKRAQDMSFESNQRYMNVCLKNSTRLKNLIKWLQEDKNSQEKMRILLIDDEADQAGINTARIDAQTRKAINKLLCALVNGNNYNNEPIKTKYKAMNYIGYTATPYANILNEASRESLYPRSFITTLQVSNEYFGPQQIFGCEDMEEYDGLDIIRNVSQEDLNLIREIHSGTSLDIPDSLADSICWFICCVSCVRIWGRKSPISLLVHTSQRTDHHSHIAESIKHWINENSRKSIINHCEKLWNSEKDRFTIENFFEQYPNYGESQIRDYPEFDTMRPVIEKFLKSGLSSIPLGEDSKPEYHKGIHLCIDNCQNNGARDGMFLRLMYPQEKMEFAPAFIVVGGATLSRGLTIEGLVSTFFLRSVRQSDTLMQMGRWFGYRKGYEILPRVWMTERAVQQFEFLSSLDYRLRMEISRMEHLGITPDKYGPRVKSHPQVSFIRITASNRMQKAEDMDFSGSTSQTYVFDNIKESLLANQEATKSFLSKLKAPEPQKVCNKHASSSFVWRDIDYSDIRDFLVAFHYSERQGAFNDIDHMMRWFDSVVSNGSLTKWNVILAGKKNSKTEPWVVNEMISVNKITRAQKKRKVEGVINIGTLRDPHDIIADIDLDNASSELIYKVHNFKSKDALSIRNESGLGNIPQLIIYVIDKNSKSSSKTRDDLNAVEDIVGICINVPEDSAGNGRIQSVAIRISNDVFNYIEDINGTDED